MLCKAGTISKVYESLVEDGYHVSENALHQWIKDGKLPSVCSGNRNYITYAHVVELLTTGSVTLPTAASQ